MIYELLTSKGVLSEKHKQELSEKRGFNDETIKEHRFFSGGKYIREFTDEFLRSFGEDELVASGVFFKPEGLDSIVISSQLLDDRVIIPYLDTENKAYFVRPHKMGLEVPIQVYHEKIFKKEKDSFAILTESEFKAVAGQVLGYRTIGVPGIASFADSHFQRLVKFIQKGGIKQICILYDNEIKDNPTYSNYKEDPFKRYDTEYFSYTIARNLLKEGIECRVGRLPDSWRVNGKIDLDGALAQGRTREEFKGIIAQANLPIAYIKELPQEAQNVINRKLAKKHYRTHISVDWGKYVAARHQGKQEWQETISNFTIKILARHETMEGVIREVVLIDEFGKHSPSFPLSSTPMVKRDAFADFVMSKGNYLWSGSGNDLVHIWRGLFLEDDGRHIVEPDHVGWLGDEKMWLFGNIAFDDGGEELYPDKHGIFWRKKYGVKPIAVSITSGRTPLREGVPILSKGKLDIEDVRQKFIETLGRFEAHILLGWAGSVIFMEEVFEAYNCFPFLFITGRRGSGKSTVAEWTSNLFGIESGGKQAADTTAVAIQRYLSYYSNLPLFIDEYRNTKNITYKNGFLRNVYNRQSAGKGIKANFGVREGKIRGTLLVSGEETPEDNALLTRCVVLNVLQSNRIVNHFNWFQDHRSTLSSFTYQNLKKRHITKAQFKVNLSHGKDHFVKKGLDDRMAINYSVIGSGYRAIFGKLPDDFIDYLGSESRKVKAEYDAEHAMQVFWDDLQAIQSMGNMRERMWEVEEDLIYVYFQGLYSIWASSYRSVHGTEPFKAGAIKKYIEEEDGYLEKDKVKRVGKHLRRCIVFLRKKAPIELISLVEEPLG